MKYEAIDNRFHNAFHIIKASCTQVTNATTTAVEIPGTKVTLLPGQVQNGTMYQWKFAGTKTGTNDKHNVLVVANGTTLLTLASDDNTAVDFVGEITLICSGGSSQKIMGIMTSTTADPVIDYAAGTENLSVGGTIMLQCSVNNTSDSVAIEMATTQAAVIPLT